MYRRNTAGGGGIPIKTGQNHESSRAGIGVEMLAQGTHTKKKAALVTPSSGQAVDVAGRQGPASSSRQGHYSHWYTKQSSKIARSHASHLSFPSGACSRHLFRRTRLGVADPLWIIRRRQRPVRRQ